MILTALTAARMTFMVISLTHKISRFSQPKQLSANIGHYRVGGTVSQELSNNIIFVFIKALSSKVLR